MTSQQCKRFNSCNAPICPLDEQYLKRIYLKSESICYYLKEAVKQNGEAKIRGVIGTTASNKVQSCLELVQSPHRPPNFGNMDRKLKLSKTTKSRLKNIC